VLVVGTNDCVDSDSRQNSFEMATSTPNDSTESIPSIKTSTPPPSSVNDSQPISEFAKSLVSTLDSQFTLSRTSVDSQSTPPLQLSEPGYFDLTPPGSISTRGGAFTAPATPTGRTIGRKGIQFSPRLEVHETWHSAEYDRRGEPATCNRLTAQLAQMIKEELNAFKLEEMEVHEVPTHTHPTELWKLTCARRVEVIHISFNVLLVYDCLMRICMCVCIHGIATLKDSVERAFGISECGENLKGYEI